MENSDKKLLYIKVPDEYTFTAKIPGFDSSIPLPLLLDSDGKDFTAESISEEMILAGMLHVFAYQRDNQRLGLLRNNRIRHKDNTAERRNRCFNRRHHHIIRNAVNRDVCCFLGIVCIIFQFCYIYIGDRSAHLRVVKRIHDNLIVLINNNRF